MFGLSKRTWELIWALPIRWSTSGKGHCAPRTVSGCHEKNTNRVLAVGSEAREMVGRTPGNIVAVRPMADGVIADFDVTERMLRHFINKASRRRGIFRPMVVVRCPLV